MKKANFNASWHCGYQTQFLYKFDIEYQQGRHNIVANALSQYFLINHVNMKHFLTEDLSCQGSETRTTTISPEMQQMNQEQEAIAEGFLTYAGWMKIQTNVTDCDQEQRNYKPLLAIIQWLQQQKIKEGYALSVAWSYSPQRK